MSPDKWLDDRRRRRSQAELEKDHVLRDAVLDRARRVAQFAHTEVRLITDVSTVWLASGSSLNGWYLRQHHRQSELYYNRR